MNIFSAWLKSLRDQRQKRLDEERKSAIKALKQICREIRHFCELWKQRPLTADEEREYAVSRRAFNELITYIRARTLKPKRRTKSRSLGFFGFFLNHSEVA